MWHFRSIAQHNLRHPHAGMAENAQDLAGADQSRPVTKTKLEGGLHVTDTVMEEIAEDEGDWDDIYGVKPGQPKQEEVGEAYSKPSAVEMQLGSGAAQPVHGESTVSGDEVQKRWICTWRSGRLRRVGRYHLHQRVSMRRHRSRRMSSVQRMDYRPL